MRVSALVALLLATLTAACAQPQAPTPSEPPDTRADDEATIRAAVRAWAAAAAAKDAETFVSFYADDVLVLNEGMPDSQGVPAVREVITAMMSDPAFALTFAEDAVTVARSGDLAYELGRFTLTMSGPDGKPMRRQGRYVVVWAKQADGTWKVKVDAPVSDGAAGPIT